MTNKIKQAAAWICVRAVKYSLFGMAFHIAITGNNPLRDTYLWEKISTQAEEIQVAKASYVMDEKPPMPSMSASAEKRHHVDRLPPLPERVIYDTRAHEEHMDELDKLHMKLAQEG